ncbi:MAG: AMP-binding protein [Deltaproteobacteria bacterium]|nr:AMP-binding protein [Deltaproteobacteria bacterium]MBN2688245.1 AMP-binding protein [Deltaproteobacteria bacterium]
MSEVQSKKLLIPYRQGAVGKSGLPGCDVVIMKSYREKALPGEAGEIWMKADSMMEGSFIDPEATNDAFSQGWYRTGEGKRADTGWDKRISCRQAWQVYNSQGL